MTARCAAALLLLAGCEPPPEQGPVTEKGSLALGDITLGSGEYQDVRSVRVRQGQWIYVRVQADGFDPYLMLTAPSGQRSELDDSTEGDTVAVETLVQAGESGSWDVHVTSYRPRAQGDYVITYHVSDKRPAP